MRDVSEASPPPASPAEALPVEALPWRTVFVDSLPGDPSRDPRSRQVHEACYSFVTPTAVSKPELVHLVPEVASLVGLRAEPTPSLTALVAGNLVLPSQRPYAACYGGHQFGNWAGQLGDGRALTLGEVEAQGGVQELQLKGAGPTPYSRRADGRAVLRSSLRELVCSEAMHHLGVPTTRALSLALTGEQVVRDMFYDGRPEREPGAVVCRVAPSFLRFGSFELHASRGHTDTLRKLLRFTVSRYYPQHLVEGEPDVGAFFAEVAERTISLVLHWMRVGFVHGVLNTDNMSILGLTIDYGPFGWVEPYDPGFTPNTTDAEGRRYRFGNQPRIVHWNLLQLGNALTPLVDDLSPLEAVLEKHARELPQRYLGMMLEKLGLDGEPTDDDRLLVAGLFDLFEAAEIDMTIFFRRLAELERRDAGNADEARFEKLRSAFYDPSAASTKLVRELGAWTLAYLERASSKSDAERRARMNRTNPLYVPRNYLLHEVIEETAAGDREALPQLLDVLRRPYEEQPGRERYAEKRPEWAREKPGCSMLSCSS